MHCKDKRIRLRNRMGLDKVHYHCGPRHGPRGRCALHPILVSAARASPIGYRQSANQKSKRRHHTKTLLREQPPDGQEILVSCMFGWS